MTVVERLARFVVARSWSDLSESARNELKIRVLDALGCALGARELSPSPRSGRSSTTSASGRSAR